MNFRLDYSDLEKKIAKRNAKVPKAASQTLTPSVLSIAKKKVVVTGSIPEMTRQQVSQLLIRHNTALYSSVTFGVNYLITGNTKGATTTKMKAAARLGIPTVSYLNVKEFVK